MQTFLGSTDRGSVPISRLWYCGEGWMPVSPGSWLVAKVSRAHLKCRPSHCAVPRTFHPNSALVLLGDLGSREAVAGGKLPVV